MKKFLAALLVLFTCLNTLAAELTGSVSFANGLYTYTYELSATATPVTEISVLVDSVTNTHDLHPLSSTSPDGWIQVTSVGVNPNDLFQNTATYFAWQLLGSGGTAAVSGFSFTTYAAPAANPVPLTYMLFSPGYNGGPAGLPNFFVGSVVAPDFLIAQSVPEPETYAMLLAGLALVGALASKPRRAD